MSICHNTMQTMAIQDNIVLFGAQVVSADVTHPIVNGKIPFGGIFLCHLYGRLGDVDSMDTEANFGEFAGHRACTNPQHQAAFAVTITQTDRARRSEQNLEFDDYQSAQRQAFPPLLMF